jgi:hypothetical protein
VEDLSRLADDSMWCTSQGGGNVTTVRPAAMSAPGSAPVNPRLGEDERPPHVAPSPEIPVSFTGKPEPAAGAPDPAAPAWKPAGSPGVTRTPPPVPPEPPGRSMPGWALA